MKNGHHLNIQNVRETQSLRKNTKKWKWLQHVQRRVSLLGCGMILLQVICATHIACRGQWNYSRYRACKGRTYIPCAKLSVRHVVFRCLASRTKANTATTQCPYVCRIRVRCAVCVCVCVCVCVWMSKRQDNPQSENLPRLPHST